MLCIGGGGVESRGKDVRTKSIPAEDNSQYARNPMEMQDVSLRAHDGILWVRLQFYRFQPEYAMYFEIYSLNPQTMTLTSIANTTVVQGRSFHDGSPCLRWISPLPYLVAAPILFLVAYWLLKCRDIPAGTTFLCLGAAACLGYADAEAWPGLLAMVSVGATVSLFTSLPPWLSRDMILWGLYTSLAVATLSDLNCWWGCGDLSIGMLAVGIGLVLNHPVLQIMGWLGMVLTPFVAAQSIMNGMQEFVIVPVVLVISSGLLSMGSYIQKHFQKYRTYLVVYTRHLWRIFLLSAEMAPNNETLSGQGRRGAATSDTVMMQGLVSTRDD